MNYVVCTYVRCEIVLSDEHLVEIKNRDAP